MFPPGLSMLWEPIDPGPALQARFGFDDVAAVQGWLSALLAKAWGVTVSRCHRVVISSANAVIWTETPGGGWVVKCSRDEDQFAALEATSLVLRDLHRCGLPVLAPVPTASGEDRITVDGPLGPLSVVAQPEIHADWLAVSDEAAVRAAGACLARLHEELRTCRTEHLPTTSRITVSQEAIRGWLASGDRGLAPAASARLAQLAVTLPALDREPQLVHNDFRAANILTKESEIVAVLDFDEVSLGQPVGDLAYAAVFLSTRFTDWAPTPVAARQQLCAGYESVRALSGAERRWYDALVLWLSIQVLPGEADPTGWRAALGEIGIA